MSIILGLVYFLSIRSTIAGRILSDPGLRETEIARVGDRIITRYDLLVLKELERVRLDKKTTEDSEILLTLLVPAVHEEILRRHGVEVGQVAGVGPGDDRHTRMKQRLEPYRGMYERLVLRPPALEARLVQIHGELVEKQEFAIWYRSECVKTVTWVRDPGLADQLRARFSDNPVADSIRK